MLLANLRLTALFGFVNALQAMSLDKRHPLPKRLKARKEVLEAQESIRFLLECLRKDTRGSDWRKQPGLLVRVKGSGLLGSILERQDAFGDEQVLVIHAESPDKPRAYYPAELEVVLPKRVFDTPA